MLVAEIHGQAVRCQGVRAYDPGPLNLLLLPGPHPPGHSDPHPTLPTQWHSSLAAWWVLGAPLKEFTWVRGNG